MFKKIFILTILGTSLVLADANNTKTVSKEQVKQKWIEKVDELLYEFDKTASKTYNKAQHKLDKIVQSLKGKNDEACAIVEEKQAELKQEFEELKNVVKQCIEEKKTTVCSEIEQIEGEINKLKLAELKLKQKLALAEEKIKFKSQLKIWSKKVDDVKDEAKKALKEIEFEEALEKLQQKYGEAYEACKEKLIQLKDKYVQVKNEGKACVEQKKLQFKKELLELKDQPEKYLELKTQARIEIAAEKAKWKLEKEQIKQEIWEIIKNLKIQNKQHKIQNKH